MKLKAKQRDFMQKYEKVHTGFVKYCKAKSYGILDYEDLHSETITRAFEGYEKLKDKAVFSAYIYGIAKNIIRNELRKKASVNKYEIYRIDRSLVAQNHAEQKFEIEVLYKALSYLPEKQKETVILFEISGYSIKEIAKIQDCGESAVKQRLKRGREQLSEILAEPRMETEKLTRKSNVLLTLFF